MVLRSVQALIKMGADTEIAGDNGNTPLLVAAREGRLQSLSALLEGGANPNTQGEGGTTPLLIAIRAGAEQRLISRLLSGKADPNNGDLEGVMPLFAAAEVAGEDVEWGREIITRYRKSGSPDSKPYPLTSILIKGSYITRPKSTKHVSTALVPCGLQHRRVMWKL